MIKNLLHKMLKSIMTMAVVVLLAGITSELNAQWCISNMQTMAAGYPYVGITRVRLFDVTTGKDVFNRSSSINEASNGYVVTDYKASNYNVFLGHTYNVYVDFSDPSYWGCYNKLFFDVNANKNFESDAIEFRSIYTNSTSNYLMGTFTLPCSAGTGETRLRVMTSMGLWGSTGTSACSNYGSQPANYGEVEDYSLMIASEVPDSYPTEGSVLFAKEIYNGTVRDSKDGMFKNVSFQKPTLVFATAPAPKGTTMKYSIVGPLPSTQVVYTALDPDPASPTFNTPTITLQATSTTSYTFTKAKDTAAMTPLLPTPGNGDMYFLEGGEYKVQIEIGGAGCAGIQARLFTASVNYDMAGSSINTPYTSEAPKFQRLPEGTPAEFKADFQNVGLNNVDKFTAKMHIYGPLPSKAELKNSPLVFEYDTADGRTLVIPGINSKRTINFGTWQPGAGVVGKYVIRTEVNYSYDETPSNNWYPRDGSPDYIIEFQYAIQLKANRILAPAAGQILVTNRQFRPEGEFRNIGINDVTDVSATMIITNDKGDKVYTGNINVTEIPTGRYDLKTATFPFWTPTKAGTYTACMTIDHPEDGFTSDNQTCQTFTVEDGMQGTFTIGTLKETASGYKTDKNFASVKELMDTLYYSGISGNCTFEFTDDSYIVSGTSLPLTPAWDMSSKIIGLGYLPETGVTNTITFKPSAAKAAMKGGVKITLETYNGIGILFGQNILPANDNAIVKTFFSKENSNSQGYITFDGGSQKALEFSIVNKAASINGNDKTNVAFYLGKGTKNINITNLVIKNGTPATANNVYVPIVLRNASNGFDFEKDAIKIGTNFYSYSSGVTLRNTLYLDSIQNRLKLDTLPCINNNISGNEISGFAYGVMSLGAGPLFDQGAGDYKTYYNYNNKITGNTIYDVTRAGVLLGFNDTTVVANNRIYNVNKNIVPGLEVAGIISGGQSRPVNPTLPENPTTNTSLKGYHNLNVTIDGNEISNLWSTTEVSGIKVEQVRNLYPKGTGLVSYPKTEENTKVMNNLVWGINNSAVAAMRGGINVTTERYMTSATQPREPGYLTTNDMIVNNSVILTQGLANATGAVAGISVRESKNASVYGNAISVDDANINPQAGVPYAALFMIGQYEKNGGAKVNRNAYWLGSSNSVSNKVSLVRMFETDAKDSIVNFGTADEYMTLPQWQAWSTSDDYSVYGNWPADYAYNAVKNNYRVKVDANGLPLNSILNNRAERLQFNTKDIDGSLRSATGDRPDIGAIEFMGRQYLNDVETSNLLAPRQYKATSGTFSDAEYIMTTNPVNVKTIIRNNGTLSQTGLKVVASIYMQNQNGTYDATPMLIDTVKVYVNANDNLTVDFKFNDGMLKEFNPQTYAELIRFGKGGYTLANMPSSMVPMLANATPIYKISIQVENDQAQDNNKMEKLVRFYLKRSGKDMLLAGRYLTIDEYKTTNTADQQASKLNYNNMLKGINKVGFFNNLYLTDTTYTKIPQVDYDVLDRTAWEARSLDYRMYANLFYSDGYAEATTRLGEQNINDFKVQTRVGQKKNLILATDELSKYVAKAAPINASHDFRNLVLRSNYTGEFFPAGTWKDTSVLGNNISKNMVVKLERPYYMVGSVKTLYTNDPMPDPDMMTGVNFDANNNPLPGLTVTGMNYNNSAKQIFALATSSVENNTIYFGTDWRTFSDAETIMRGVFDYLTRNGGFITPVELAQFNANSKNNTVVLDWTTASEINTSKFEVEKATVSTAGKSTFTKIDEVAAAGNSASDKYYGPVVDRDVKMGATYAYRLKTVDRDGEFTNSDERVVTMSSEAGIVTLNEVTPNPANATSTLTYSISNENNVSINVYDINGAVVFTANEFKSAGTHNVNMEWLSKSSTGVYTVVLTVADVVVSKQVNLVK